MKSIINNADKFKSDIMKMMTKGTSNDVKIVLEDGEIHANKDVLCARSDYFATMLSNEEVKFMEGETKRVDMNYCSKIIMEKIIKYLFSGDMTLHDISLPNLVKMMNITSMMMLEDVYDDVKDYVLESIPGSGEDYAALPELVNSLMLAENFKLELVKEVLVSELFFGLTDIPHIPDVVQNSEAFKMLPANLLKAILFKRIESEGELISTHSLYYDDDEEEEEDDGEDDLDLDQTLDQFLASTTYVEEDDEDYPSDEDTDDDDTGDCDNEYYAYLNGYVKDDDRLKAFLFWLSGNECSDEDKKEIKDSIDLMHSCFTAEKLLTCVRRSGLYSIKEIDDRLLEIISCARKELEFERRRRTGRSWRLSGGSWRQPRRGNLNSGKIKSDLMYCSFVVYVTLKSFYMKR